MQRLLKPAQMAALKEAVIATAPPGRRLPPRLDDLLQGLWWRCRTGAPWRDVPARFGHWRSLHQTWFRWARSGRFQKILAYLQRQAGGADLRTVFLDGTKVRAHAKAAGAKGGRPISDAPGAASARRRSPAPTPPVASSP